MKPRRSAPLFLVATTIVVWLLPPPAHAAAAPLGRTTRIEILDVNGEKVTPFGVTLSADGGSLLIWSTSPLVPADTNGDHDIYLMDLATGAAEQVSLTDDDKVPNGHSQYPAISKDGRYVAFRSDATNMVTPDANGATFDVYVRDRVAGTTTRVSVSTQGVQGDAQSTEPSISADGGAVAFLSSATNLVAGDTNGASDVFVRELATGTTERVSVSSSGDQALTPPESPEISGNGRHVVFGSAFPYSPGDTNAPSRDIYVHDRVTRATERASVASDGSEGNLASFYPTISHDGRHVAFSSFNANYVPNDTNGASESFVHDMQTGRTDRLVGPDGQQGNSVVGVPVISEDARFVTANFLPSNYGYPDANQSTDVYRIDRLTGQVDLVSTTAEGTTGDAISYSPTMSGDGRFIAFYSQATDLMDDGKGGGLFLRDLGPSLGAASISAAPGPAGVEVTGWARLSAGPLVTVTDSDGDASPAARSAGAELTGASLTYRPERADLRARIHLAPRRHVWPPLVGTSLQKPGALTYGVDLFADGVTYQARAVAGPAGPTFSLYRCVPACTKTADLAGGIGTAGDDVLISIPLGAVGLAEGSTLEGAKAFVSPGEDTTGPVAVLDQVSLPGTAIPISAVDLGVAPHGTPGSQVAFDVRASFRDGAFTGKLPEPGSGQHDVWARVCLGNECTAESVPIA